MQKFKPFKNFLELTNHLHTEDDAKYWLAKVRWGDNPRCGHCGNNVGNYFISTRNIYKCSDSDCRKQFSVLRGTIFECTRIPLKTWFWAMFEIANSNISSCKLAAKIGVNQKTAWKMMHKIRHLMSDENETTMLYGTVECDECSIAPKLNRDLQKRRQVGMEEKRIKKIYGENHKLEGGKRWRKRKKLGLPPGVTGRPKGSKNKPRQKLHKNREYYKYYKVVFGMTERKGKVVLKKIGQHESDVKKEKIERLMQKHIYEKTRVITDGSKLYDDTSIHFLKHDVIFHEYKIEYKTKSGKIKLRRASKYVEGDVYTNSMENAWMHLKRTLWGKHVHVTYQHLDRYLAEFSFYWNRRNLNDCARFTEMLGNSLGRVLQYKEFKMFTRIDKKRVVLAKAA